jgi:alkylation response protein AidB-like acyl-CoA dehydrogenase
MPPAGPDSPPLADCAPLRREVREFVADQRANGHIVTTVDNWLSGFDPAFSRRLGERGWIGMTIPREYGGHGRSALERFAVSEELLAAGAPVGFHWIADRQIGPALLSYGSPAQRASLLPRIARGELCIAVCLSEPDSGSDLASVQTRAVPAGERRWRIEGAKAWTSGAQHAEYLVVFCRTGPVPSAADPAGRAKDQFTQFLVPAERAGVSVRPCRWLDGSLDFNDVLFDGVEVSASDVLGTVGGGWQQVIGELAWERSGPERFLSTMPLLDQVVRAAATGGGPASDLVTATLGALTAELWSVRELSITVAADLDRGAAPELTAALVKDLGTDLEQRSVDSVRQLLDSVERDSELGRLLARSLARSPAFTLRGGTSQILRGIVAKGRER